MELAAAGLKNDRIALQALSESHREALRASDAIEYMWLSMPAIQRGAGFDAYFDHILRSSKKDEIKPFALLDPNDDNRFVGVTAFIAPSKTHRRVQIGYTWLEPHLRGQGVYASIQHLMIKRALDWGARRIAWHVEARNERAIRAIQALGAKEEGTLRNHSKFADGEWVDLTILSMLRDEAKEAVTRLEAVLASQAT